MRAPASVHAAPPPLALALTRCAPQPDLTFSNVLEQKELSRSFRAVGVNSGTRRRGGLTAAAWRGRPRQRPGRAPTAAAGCGPWPTPPGKTQCFLTYRLHAKFAQKFNLREFPMDRQLLFVEAVLWACPVEKVLSYDEEGLPKETALYEGRILWKEGKSMLYGASARHARPLGARGARDAAVARPLLQRARARRRCADEHFIQGDVWRIARDVTMCYGHTDERRRDNGDGQRFHTLAVTLELQRKPRFYIMNGACEATHARAGGVGSQGAAAVR